MDEDVGDACGQESACKSASFGIMTVLWAKSEAATCVYCAVIVRPEKCLLL